MDAVLLLEGVVREEFVGETTRPRARVASTGGRCSIWMLRNAEDAYR